MKFSVQLYWFPVVVCIFSGLIVAAILYVSHEMSRASERADYISGLSMQVHSMEGKLHDFRETGNYDAVVGWSRDLNKLTANLKNTYQFPAEQQTLFNSIAMGAETLTVLTKWLIPGSGNDNDRQSEVSKLMFEKLFSTTEYMAWDIYWLEQLEKQEILSQSRSIFVQVSTLLVVCALLFLLIALRISNKIRHYLSIMHRGLKQVESGEFVEPIHIAYRSDEFCDFIKAFNEVARKLKETTVSKNELEQIIEKKTFLLDHLANTDPLTQVYNRRKFIQHGQKELARAKRYKTPLSVVMIDGDDFKMINDKHGHHVGDEVLINLCRIIEHEIRENDLLARWGGEEFVILLPQTDIHGAKDIAQRICDEVASDPLNISNILIHLTVSIGVAQIEEDSALEDIIDRADEALYWTKKHGKNGVSVY